MKLIDDRFRINRMINEGLSNESYIVSDLLDKEDRKSLTLYMGKRDKKTIDYFIEEFLNISKIKHDRIVEAMIFDRVNTINLKGTNLSLYYTVSEYIDYPLLSEYTKKLSLNHRLKIVLDLMNVIGYIHFRGYIYKHLSPKNIFISNEGQIKLRDLATISEHVINSNYDDITDRFIAPEVFIDAWNISKKADYYSLGMMMKYLLYEDSNMESHLSMDQKKILGSIIQNLTEKNPNHRDILLSTHMEDIIKEFQLDITYDLIKERNQIYFNNNIVDRESELKKIIDIDNLMVRGIKQYNAAVITGKIGSGRSKLLEEFQYKLKMLGRRIYYFKIEGDNPIENINNIVNAMDYNPSRELLNKYKSGLITKEERYRFYNKITNYFAEISKENIIYIIIDDINQGDEGLVSLVNYLIFNLGNNKVFFILSTVNPSLIYNEDIRVIVEEWKGNESTLALEINNLSDEDVGTMVKSILAMPYIPRRFAKFLYEESQGNLKYLEYIIKDLYNREELYMSKEGNWKTKTRDYSKIYIPLEKNHLIESQLKKIKGKELTLLKAMSVFKNIILRSILMEVVDIEIEDIDNILKKFKNDRIIEYKNKDLGCGYTFYNTELKRVVYKNLRFDEKIYFHKKIADLLLESYFNKSNIGLEELVYHLVQSDYRDMAIELCLGEAKKQANKYNPYAINIWELAYEVSQGMKNEKTLYIIDKLIEIYFLKGNIEETEYYLDRLYNIAKQGQDIEYLIKANYYRADIHLIENRLDIAEELIDELLNLAKSHNFYEGQIMGMVLKGKLALGNNNLDNIPDVLNEGIEISRKSKVLGYLGEIYNIYGIYHHLRGNISTAIDYFIRSIEEKENIVETIKPINNLGNIYNSASGDEKKALEYYQKGYDIANKYGLNRYGSGFSNNIGDIYLSDLQYSKALPYFEKAKENAAEIGDVRGKVIANLNLGSIYLQTSKYEKAYEIYKDIKEVFEKTPILEAEIEIAYYNYLGEFCGYFGKWEEGIKYSYKASKGYKGYNIREYLKAQYHILTFRYFKEGYYNKEEIIKLLDRCIETKTTNDLLYTIFRFSLISSLEGDKEFAKELLYRFNNTVKDLDLPMIIDFITLMELNLTESQEDLEEIEAYHLNSNCEYLYLDYLYHYKLGGKWFKLKQYKKSLEHFLKATDVLYRKVNAIEDKQLKRNLIKTRFGYTLKSYLYKAIELQYNREFKYALLKDVGDDYYIDIKNILEVLSNEEFYDIMSSGDKNYNIKDLQELLSQLGSDYKENLDLILSFIKYKTLAHRGYILWLDDNTKEYQILSSILEEDKAIPNENLLIQSNRSELGILINRTIQNDKETKYMEFLPGDAIGIMCIPIIDDKNKYKTDRRKNNLNGRNKGYLYLETSSFLNKFNYESLLLLNTLSNLIYLNIDNHILKHISTTDKLTGVLTRKYFDFQLDELIENQNKYQGQFSLLMLDIDDFKDINDNYGHQKGDEVLALIGKEIKENVRSTDLVARYGGEEFILVLFNTSIKEGMKIGEKVKEGIENLRVPGVHRVVTASIGLSQYPEHSQFKNELIGKADQALYTAKEKRRKNNIQSWTLEMGDNINRGDKLAGIYTGNSVKDNANISAILDIAKSIKSNRHIKDKTYRFLGTVLDVLKGEYASIFQVDNGVFKGVQTRLRNKVGWVETPSLNECIIKKVCKTKEAETLIDWENMEELDEVSSTPIWQSLMVIPLVKNGEVKKILYISVPLKEKEFNFKDLNLGELLSSIFIANLK